MPLHIPHRSAPDVDAEILCIYPSLLFFNCPFACSRTSFIYSFSISFFHKLVVYILESVIFSTKQYILCLFVAIIFSF